SSVCATGTSEPRYMFVARTHQSAPIATCSVLILSTLEFKITHSSMNQKLRILLAEDHETVREGLKLIISAQPDMDVVAMVADGPAAIDATQRFEADVVVMDISMPRVNGLKATEKLRECCPQVKVLALTRHKDEGYLQQILRAGASGYVLKQSAPAELLHA